MPYGLDKVDIKNIIGILKLDENIKEAVLFGSRAKGTYKNGSDIDIAIKGSNLNLNNIIEISSAIDELWLPYKFDIIIYERINDPALIEHIERVGIILYRK